MKTSIHEINSIKASAIKRVSDQNHSLGYTRTIVIKTKRGEKLELNLYSNHSASLLIPVY